MFRCAVIKTIRTLNPFELINVPIERCVPCKRYRPVGSLCNHHAVSMCKNRQSRVNHAAHICDSRQGFLRPDPERQQAHHDRHRFNHRVGFSVSGSLMSHFKQRRFSSPSTPRMPRPQRYVLRPHFGQLSLDIIPLPPLGLSFDRSTISSNRKRYSSTACRQCV